ncbi:leucine-rich repeat-containing G-protein coupled receptor 6-like [Photinus pyralis]|nr:leucine-rich repeat-containing G-protein coupled receptor 6-like [Photinus pyralis]
MFKAHVLLLLLILKHSLLCSTPSFNNNVVNVNKIIKERINGCISPETLKFKGKIEDITITFQNLPDLNGGAIRDISSKFNITLHDNNIGSIKSEAFFNLSGLVGVNLYTNKIKLVSTNSLTNLPSLTSISLSWDNEVTISPSAFSNLPQLAQVMLDFNNLDTFEQDWFDKTPKLRELHMIGNHLRTIPKAAFTNLQSINLLNFQGNKIESIDKDAFMGLRNLNKLILKQNKLKSFDIDFHTHLKLTYLAIDYNNITFIPDKVLDTIQSHLLTIHIVGNPWQCGCFHKLISWGAKNAITTFSQCPNQELVCVYPKTNPNECIERSDDDFYSEAWTPFVVDTLCYIMNEPFL